MSGQVGDAYTCSFCGREYEKTRDDDEAQAEAVERFGAEAMAVDPQIVCDDCYRATKAMSDADVWSRQAALNASEQIRQAVDEARADERNQCAQLAREFSELDNGVPGCCTAFGEGMECGAIEGIAAAIEGRGA